MSKKAGWKYNRTILRGLGPCSSVFKYAISSVLGKLRYDTPFWHASACWTLWFYASMMCAVETQIFNIPWIKLKIMQPGLSAPLFLIWLKCYGSANSNRVHTPLIPRAFVRHFKTLSSPWWGICSNRSAQGWGIVNASLFALNFLSAPNITILKLSW